jgi:hypothetical protein
VTVRIFVEVVDVQPLISISIGDNLGSNLF